MYFWKTNLLINELKENKLTQLSELKYFLTYSLFILLSMSPFFNTGKAPTTTVYINSGITITMTVIGILYCYKINKNGDNKDFLRRMYCLSIPISIRMITFLLPLSILFWIVYYIVFPTDQNNEVIHQQDNVSIWKIAFMTIFCFCYYYLLGNAIKKISFDDC